jgi:hypothetical protein
MPEMFDQIFYGPVLFGIGIALLVFELIVLVLASGRRRRGEPFSFRLHAIAGAAIVPLPVAVGLSMHAARAAMLAVFSGTSSADATDKAMAVSRGLASQVNALPFAVAATGLALALWFAGLAYTMSAVRSDGSGRGFPPVALVGAGLLPTAFGVLQWSSALIVSFAAVAGQPPDEKVVVIARALDAAHAQLTRTARISMALIPILGVLAVVLIVRRDRKRDAVPRDSVPARAHPTSARWPLVLSTAALLLAALLFVEARPLAAENDLPWPPPTTGAQLVSVEPPTPDVIGPDAIERAPVVLVYRDDLGLDGTKGEDFQSLEDKLVTLRNNYRLLHPGEGFGGTAVIVADPTTDIPRLISVLRAVRGSDYHNPMFAFTKGDIIHRPVLGKLQRIQSSGARIRLAYLDGQDEDEYEFDDEAEAEQRKNAVPLRLSDFADHGAFARRLVELRRAGKPVIVKIDRRTDRAPR